MTAPAERDREGAPRGDDALVGYARIGRVAVLTLDDAARRNSLSTGVVRAMLRALAASRRDGMRAVVIAARGKVFSAGANIREMLELRWFEWSEPDPAVPTPLDLFEAIEADPRPVIAAVDAPAYGGGVELTLVCDLVIAGPGAAFVFPEIGHGAIPNTAMARLPSIIGRRAAIDLMLSRRRVDAAEAHVLGLVDRLVEQGQLMDACTALAEAIVAAPPCAIALVKRATAGRGAGWPEIRRSLQASDPREWREGMAAFVERRAPDFDPAWEALLGESSAALAGEPP
jgi:enoyl-CoA hydratase/carnithine racemase